MEYFQPLLAIIGSIAISLFSSHLYFKYQRHRARSIEKKLLTVQEEEAFLDRLNKGNVALIRVGFTFVAVIFGYAFVAAFLVLMVQIFSFTGQMRIYLYCMAGGLMISGAYICFYFSRSIVRLRNLPAAKELLQKQRDKLQSQL